MTFQIVTGLSTFAPKYDAFILDLWGVVHDGTKPYPGVLDCLSKLREDGRPVLLLSNAPRTSNHVTGFLKTLGIEPQLYDHILTSGDLTRQVLIDREQEFLKKKTPKFYQFGAAKDRGIEDELDYLKVDDLAEADFLICTGLANDTEETPEAYRDLLTKSAALGLPMLCANPDLTVMKGETMLYCAGALAALYEELGAPVTLYGKPYPNAYELAMKKLGVSDPAKILAVGDSMRTDIKGANGMGIDNVLIAGGIHAEEWGLRSGDIPSREQVEEISALHGFAPTYVSGHMTW